jgi:phospholipid N-methyltransferase
MRFKQSLRFAQQFFRQPRTTGALLPSGKALGQAMADSIDWDQVSIAVEIGPGSGAFTGELLRRVGDSNRLMLVEINPSFVDLLRSAHPELEIIQGNVEDLRSVLKNRSTVCVDAIVSGLPWTIFESNQQERMIASIRSSLCRKGQFSTFIYLQGLILPGGKRLVKLLEKNFKEIRRTKVVWANLPPAVIFKCRP